MKSQLVFAALVALVAGGAIPLVPGNSRYYVDSENKFADDDSQVANLHELLERDTLSRSGANNQYWLYTRLNPNSPQVITQGNAMSIWASHYLGSRALKVIVHGFGETGNSEVNSMLTSAWLATIDANVIVVDWRALASSNYATAVNQAPDVGRGVATFVSWLINTAGGNWNSVHLAGTGMGGQIAGIAGRHMTGRPRRLTGLDPVGTSWFFNSNAIGMQGHNEAQYVEIIHTAYTRTNSPRIGHVDFYPNGGNNQPGCSTVACSQNRAYQLFAATIRFNHLIGIQCATANEAQNNQCSGSMMLHMGNGNLAKNALGIYRVNTGSNWPF